MTSLSKRRYLDRTIQDEIEFRAMEGWTPIQIYEKLEMKHKNEKLEGTLPSLRTVQRVVKDVTVEDRSGTWNLSDCKGEDAKLILEVISELVIQTDGKVCSLTKAEAEWIVKIRKAVPDMKLYSTWAMARLYLIQESSGLKEFQALDNYLSFTPWRSKYHNYFYSKAISEGWIKECSMAWHT